MKNYNKIKNKLLKNKKIKRAYDELESEYALIETLIQKRLEKGLTQEELAKKIKTKQPAISRLESGSYNPSVNFLRKVAHALDSRLRIFLT